VKKISPGVVMTPGCFDYKILKAVIQQMEQILLKERNSLVEIQGMEKA
jgi:hypothetical protein